MVWYTRMLCVTSVFLNPHLLYAETVVSHFPPFGAHAEEEEHDHEEETGGDVHQHTEAQVYVGETKAQKGHPWLCLLVQTDALLLPLLALELLQVGGFGGVGPVLGVFPPRLLLRGFFVFLAPCCTLLRSCSVFRGDVGGPIMPLEEGQHLFLVPGMQPLNLLVAGRTQIGGRPLSLGELWVLTESSCRGTADMLHSVCETELLHTEKGYI